MRRRTTSERGWPVESEMATLDYLVATEMQFSICQIHFFSVQPTLRSTDRLDGAEQVEFCRVGRQALQGLAMWQRQRLSALSALPGTRPP